MTEQTDVSPASSPESVTSEPQQSAAQAHSSAETIKTEERGPIPYERFKEVNDQLREMREAQESADWRGYQAIKDRLEQDQGFAQYYDQMIRGYFGQQQQSQQQRDPYADYPDEIASPLREHSVLKQAVQSLLQQNQSQQEQAVYGQYMSRLNERMSEAKVPDFAKNFYLERAVALASRSGANALSGYDQSFADRIFDAVNQEAQTLERGYRGSYVVDKSKDRLPVSTSGATPTQVGVPKSAEERSSMVLELMRAGGR